MRRFAVFLSAVLLLTTSHFATAGTLGSLEMENLLQSRAQDIVSKVDASAVVSVQIELKKISATLPGMGLSGQVTPVSFDGSIGPESIERIKVRIVSSKEIPDWIQDEVKKAVSFEKVKAAISFEKVKNPIQEPSNRLEEFIQKDAFEVAKTGASALGSLNERILWSVIVIGAGLLCLGLAIWFSVRILQGALVRTIEQKVLPAMAEMRASPMASPVQRGRDESVASAIAARPAPLSSGAVPGAKELADLPIRAIRVLFADCYWTECDSYAHYLWSQMNQEQRDQLIESKVVPVEYLSHIRQFGPQDMGYHLDARYLFAGEEFLNVDQRDLLAWLRKNKSAFSRISPLRAELLGLSLGERIELTNTAGGSKPVVTPSTSKPRALPRRLEIAKLTNDDEIYLWQNREAVPLESREKLKTLVWLALAPDAYVTGVLEELDAKQLAEAWSAPPAVLERLESRIPVKKREMLQHFIKGGISADRNGDVFAYLVEAGLRGIENSSVQAAA